MTSIFCVMLPGGRLLSGILIAIETSRNSQAHVCCGWSARSGDS